MTDRLYRYAVTYACPDHGFGVKAIDRIWCWECVIEGRWVKVEHVAREVKSGSEPPP